MTGTRVFSRGDYQIGVATEFGPRIVSLSWRNGGELFAQLDPSITVAHPDRPYVLHGGHRLWVAPEVPELTYAPDDVPCDVSENGQRIVLKAGLDGAGITKGISIDLDDGRLRVEHRLTNAGDETIEVAAWAISQVPLGGEAILPLGRRADRASLQADRRLVLWPYTELGDARISFDSDTVRVATTPGPRIKIGSGPATDRLDYVRGNQRFTKTFDIPEGKPVLADLGAVAQVFSADNFGELESLGPVVALAPGDSTTHIEYWSVHSA